MIILVTGGRDYNDWPAVCAALDKLHALYPITGVVHGAARGADWLAADWAFGEFIPDYPCPAHWGGYLTPNPTVLVPRPQYCVAFPGGNGTADMISRATAHGLTVWEPYK